MGFCQKNLYFCSLIPEEKHSCNTISFSCIPKDLVFFFKDEGMVQCGETRSASARFSVVGDWFESRSQTAFITKVIILLSVCQMCETNG